MIKAQIARLSLPTRLVLTASAALLLLWGWNFYAKEREIAALQRERASAERLIQTLEQEIEELEALLALKDDLDYIELLARRELGLIFPGEEKYILIEP